MRMILFILSICVLYNPCFSEEKKTICLNMIIKDESPVIRRCLESVKPIIDYWVIVDTGSTDGTQEIVKEFMKDIPGELHERPWKNFGHNRNEALSLAKGKGDYVLIIDADETLDYKPGFTLPPLQMDFYYIMTEFGGTNYVRNQLIKNSLNWKWVGVLHEVLCCDEAFTCQTLPLIANFVRPDGNRSTDPLKYHKDAKLLEDAMLEEPNNTRNQFYLAQSYRDAGENEKAIENYKKRIAMGGWDEELFWSYLQIGILQERLNKTPDEIRRSYSVAYESRPSRIEPLYRLAYYNRSLNDFEGAYQASKKGIHIKNSKDLLFVEKWIYDYALLLEYSIAAYWTNRFHEALLASEVLLRDQSLPQNVRECVERNMYWIHLKINETIGK